MTQVLDRKVAPKFRNIQDIHIPEPQKIRYKDDSLLYAINAGTQEVIKLELIFEAGKWYEPMNIVAQAVASLIFSGNEGEKAAQIAEKFDFYGAFFEAQADEDRAYISLYSLKKNFKQTLALLLKTIKEASFPQSEFDVFVQNQKQRFTVNLEKVDFLARREFFSAIMGCDHPYGKCSQISDFDKLSREILLQYYNEKYLKQAPLILLSGLVGDDEINLVKDNFASWPSSHVSAAGAVPIKQAQKKEVQIIKENALQSSILLGNKAITRIHPDFQELSFLNTLLGGYFGSRLMANIREDKGYTYGIHSSLGSPRHQGYWAIGTEVGKAVSNDTLKEIYVELDRLKNEPIADAEIELVKNYLTGGFLRSIDGPFAIADRLKAVLLFDLDFQYYHRWLHTLNHIDAKRLQELANKYFDKNNVYQIVAGA